MSNLSSLATGGLLSVVLSAAGCLAEPPDADIEVTRELASSEPLTISKTGNQFRFHIADQRGVLLTSKLYATEAAASDGGAALFGGGLSRENFTVGNPSLNATGVYYIVVDDHGDAIGETEKYPSRASAEAAVDALLAITKAAR